MEQLIRADGTPHLGIFDKPVGNINHRDFDYRDGMDKPRGRWPRFSHFNQFHFIGMVGEPLIMGCAIVDLKLVGNAFVYFFDPRTRKLEEYSFLQPFARKTRIPTTPDQGTCHFQRGQNRFEITATADPRRRHMTVRLASGPHLDAIIEEPPGYQPLALCTRAGYSGWTYTQKAAGLKVEGTATWGDRTIDLAPLVGNYDWSCGYMRRVTCWNWACCAGQLGDGRIFGLNLASGVNETGFTENGFWVNGTFHKVDMVHFDYQRYNPEASWNITSGDNRINLEARPLGQRTEKINVGFMASNFRQLVASFHGQIKVNGEETLVLDGEYGYVEDHYARW